ncbi:ATP-binding protein [Candidatus Electronema aureum]
MSSVNTAQILSSMADAGKFELLATAILRAAEPAYRSLAHPGVNADGKTVKSPLDGICFVQGADPPHMIAVHHTIADRDGLEEKWLHDSTTVKPRKGPKPTAPDGDLIKTAKIAAEERTRRPNLRVTLVLTTNKEPREDLIRKVHAVGHDYGLEIDIWSCSCLSDFLDNTPVGQWLRRSFLNIEQTLLSAKLLHELSKRSLQTHRPLDDANSWVSRELDSKLSDSLRRNVTFLVAASGMGKSVACYRRLAAHVEAGGFGIILPHEVIASAISLEQAVAAALRQLYSSLAEIGNSALSFCSPDKPLLLIVEDINKSGQAQHLAEKLIRWGCASKSEESRGDDARWHLVCPLWPEVYLSLGHQAKQSIEPLMMTASGFSNNEGREAVLRRAQLAGHSLSPLAAEELANALGHDPLLIALHDHNTEPDPQQVVGQFVENVLSRMAAEEKAHPAAEFRQALRRLAGEMLARRQIELRWQEVSSWANVQGEPLRLLSRLANQGELLRLTGTSDDQRLSFRHDRVRDWLLADAAADLDRQDLLTEDVLSEPYFAEVMGAVLAAGQAKENFLQRVAKLNPLALFHAFRLLGQQIGKTLRRAVLQAINAWMDNPAAHEPCNEHLRWEALAMLMQTDAPEVPALVCKFNEQGHYNSGQLARLRNGDVAGGIEFCIRMSPGDLAPWRDAQMEHAKIRHGSILSQDLQRFLRRDDLDSKQRAGALCMAGHLANHELALAIEACWNTDKERDAHLDDYLWAFAECCGDEPARFLAPVCNAWAALSDERPDGATEQPSPRNAVLGYSSGLNGAFRRWPPSAAIDYFIERAAQDELRWLITCMLHKVDHPKAISFVVHECAAMENSFVVHECAAMEKSLEGTGFFSSFAMNAYRDWQTIQEYYSSPMSQASRDMLLNLWQDESNDKYLRKQAFSFWAATKGCYDIEVLKTAKESAELSDNILRARLVRGDLEAIPHMIEKIAADNGDWWFYGRYLWSADLTDALEKSLERCDKKATQNWGDSFESSYIADVIMRLPVDEAEKILLKYWKEFYLHGNFVQAALYVATPSLLHAVETAVDECPEPANLFKFLSQRIVTTGDRSGIARKTQLHALVDYLKFLSPMDIHDLWNVCNKQGWFSIRRKFLDDRLQDRWVEFKWDKQRAFSQLDDMVNKEHWHWVDHCIDDFIKTDVSWDEIYATMMQWLQERCSFDALRIVAAAVEHRGTRDDMEMLMNYEGASETEEALALILDTEFAVRRRSIR